MKPKTQPFYITSDGKPVATIDEWKRAELEHLLEIAIPKDGNYSNAGTIKYLVDCLIKDPDAFIGILAVKPKGRPLNKKDSKPRAKAAKTEAA